MMRNEVNERMKYTRKYTLNMCHLGRKRRKKYEGRRRKGRRGRGRKETLILSIGPLRPRCRIRQLRSVFATSARIPTNSPHPTRVPSPQYAGTKPHRHHQPSLQLSLAVLPLLPRHRWRYFSPSSGCTSPDRPEIPGTLPARPARPGRDCRYHSRHPWSRIHAYSHCRHHSPHLHPPVIGTILPSYSELPLIRCAAFSSATDM